MLRAARALTPGGLLVIQELIRPASPKTVRSGGPGLESVLRADQHVRLLVGSGDRVLAALGKLRNPAAGLASSYAGSGASARDRDLPPPKSGTKIPRRLKACPQGSGAATKRRASPAAG